MPCLCYPRSHGDPHRVWAVWVPAAIMGSGQSFPTRRGKHHQSMSTWVGVCRWSGLSMVWFWSGSCAALQCDAAVKLQLLLCVTSSVRSRSTGWRWICQERAMHFAYLSSSFSSCKVNVVFSKVSAVMADNLIFRESLLWKMKGWSQVCTFPFLPFRNQPLQSVLRKLWCLGG